MKKIIIKTIKAELDAYGVEPTAQQLVLNNISLFNDLIDEYKTGSKHQTYLIYQLSLQIFKMLMELKKTKNINDDSDAFTKMVDSIRKQKLEKRSGQS